MTRFHEQMKQAREGERITIRDYQSWTLQDYRDFMFCVEKGYLVQDLSGGTHFMINQEWEGDDIYAEEFEELLCTKCKKGITYDDCIHYKEDIYFCSECVEGKDNVCIECYKRPCVCSDGEEYVEYEVESGYMIDEETFGKSWTTCFNKSEKESAILEYNRLKNGGEYDFVDLVERTMEGEDCMFSDIIMEWKKE